MKVARHEKIIELIHQYDIDTQEELASRLNEAGFKVTQATVSRDIRALKQERTESLVMQLLIMNQEVLEKNIQEYWKIPCFLLMWDRISL